ncbi:amidohydrolase [Paracoccus litorisediminis]|uniref:Amidohydrolase family protein n=1 Tax=Paracoccus litorisediminis TaxID=2006130 RepID=A0A844HPN8_9RHOB|nr:amidohydrolase [Paracoccus litorisediminis]MTH60115.1 amidohydrolase family protein [Paracoccus litorisediminis]
MIDTILTDGRITTLDPACPEAEALAISGGRIAAVGSNRDIMRLKGDQTQVIELAGRRVIPGLNDSHTHLIRGGLSYNMELRWENVPSLADALRMLREQAARTPAPQWVRVIGGWSEFQFAERRMPSLDEINAAAPDTPVFVLHLYARALLNRAALRVLGIGPDTPNPPGGVIERDARGNPTGMLLAKPSALILYSTLAQGPKLPLQDQINSTRHFMRELSRLGITSVIDAGGGGQNYPEDYEVIRHLDSSGQLTLRLAYNLFAQKPGSELSDYERWIAMTEPGAGSDLLRMNGAGENLTWSAADFENFLEPRPEPGPHMEAELERIVELLATNGWPFRIHATYDETIDRFLTVFERVNGRTPFHQRFIIDHAETITPRNIERIRALGGGIAIQHRMAFQGEYFAARYGIEAARATPPVARMLADGVPVGGGTDATRVASYDPWVALHWLTTGRSLGGLQMTEESALLDRETALRIWTEGSSWFSGESGEKGRLVKGFHADLAVLSTDYMRVPDDQIRGIRSVLTMLAGKVVYGEGGFAGLAPPLPPASPDWSPVGHLPSPGQRPAAMAAPGDCDIPSCHSDCRNACALHAHDHSIAWNNKVPVRHAGRFWGALGCSCFAI